MRRTRKAPLPEEPEPSQANLRKEHLYSLREACPQQRATCPHRHAAPCGVCEDEAEKEAVESGAKTSAGSQEKQVTARLPQGRGEEPGTPVEARNAAENVAKRQQVAQERCCPRQVAPTGPGSLCSARRRRQELFLRRRTPHLILFRQPIPRWACSDHNGFAATGVSPLRIFRSAGAA